MAMARDGPAPREGALSWDDYFMSLAFLTAMRSKDPSTQVGACIVNDRNRIIGVGYNGMPSNCSNDDLPWSKKSPEGELATKYPYVVHAELNAVLNKNAESCSGCRIYSTLFPCNECAKVIIQAGIKQVIYASDKHSDRTSAKASRRLFALAGVELRQHVPEKEQLNLPLRYDDEAKRSTHFCSVNCSACTAVACNSTGRRAMDPVGPNVLAAGVFAGFFVSATGLALLGSRRLA
mmetsp:Transcript_20803/g.39078  ORF Transcript_20803/g.39078 Transcript_20803/m.39078 type:complete len:235 (-) Transcript_20803:86-790(-)